MIRYALPVIFLVVGCMIETTLAAPLPQKVDEEVYIVQAGDWLSKIAEKYYGDVWAYPIIVDITNEKAREDDRFTRIDNVDLVEVGQKLWIPKPACTSFSEPTEVIFYVPDVPIENEDGWCTSWSPYRWECSIPTSEYTLGYDRCAIATDDKTIVCNLLGEEVGVLKLDPALVGDWWEEIGKEFDVPLSSFYRTYDYDPKEDINPIMAPPLQMELANGTTCFPKLGGTLPPLVTPEDTGYFYLCYPIENEDEFVIGDLYSSGPVWYARSITVISKEENPWTYSETIEPVRRVWYVGTP
jgi:hypothetical protein